MKITRILLLLFILCASTNMITAQSHNHSAANMEEVRKKRAEYFTKELGLTASEVTTFIPLVDELYKKRFQIYRNARDKDKAFSEQKDKSSADYDKQAADNLEMEEQKVQLEKVYSDKFRDVLPAEKVYKFKTVDQQYMVDILERRKAREGRSNH